MTRRKQLLYFMLLMMSWCHPSIACVDERVEAVRNHAGGDSSFSDTFVYTAPSNCRISSYRVIELSKFGDASYTTRKVSDSRIEISWRTKSRTKKVLDIVVDTDTASLNLDLQVGLESIPAPTPAPAQTESPEVGAKAKPDSNSEKAINNGSQNIETILKIFGTGGLLAAIYYWWILWSGRRRITARIIRETYDTKESPYLEVTLELEVTNLGDKSTALNREIVVKASTPKGEPNRFTLYINDENRELPSNSPKNFVATGKLEAVFSFTWFRRYRISVTRGKGINILHRNASGADNGFIKYWYEYYMFKLFNKVPKKA